MAIKIVFYLVLEESEIRETPQEKQISFSIKIVKKMANWFSFLTTVVTADKPNSANPKPSKIDLDRTTIGNYEIACWGSNNFWISKAEEIINKVGTIAIILTYILRDRIESDRT